MDLYIRNMVCDRCIAAVKKELDQLNIPYTQVLLGEVALPAPIDERTTQQLRKNLAAAGFELLDDARKQLIEKIKTAVIQYVRNGNGDGHLKFSSFLADTLHKDYSSLSKLFSEVEGITLEQYLIRQKTERVKELIVYDEKSLSEIAFEMGYSSVAHLSSQFKKNTGLTPSHFKQLGGIHRKPIDRITE